MLSPIRIRETERNILIEMYKFALELSNSEIPKLYELGHYLADNLISKICMVVAQECDTNFNVANYENKSFPDLFRDTIEHYYPNTLRYSDIEQLHIKRNWYQHKFWSIPHHFNRQYALDYISKVKQIMITIGIINQNDDIQPSNYLRNQESEETTRRTSIATTAIIDSYDEIKALIKAVLKNHAILYYKSVNTNSEIKTEIGRKIKSLINKLKELDDPQAFEFMGEGGNVQHNRIIATFFGLSIERFTEKLRNNEIEPEIVKRPLIVLAGDLALIFQDHYEESMSNKHNFLKEIRGEYAVCIGKYETLRESYVHQRFLNAFNILKRDPGLIQQIGPDFDNSESLTEWKIIDPIRVEDFIKKKSINKILRTIL